MGVVHIKYFAHITVRILYQHIFCIILHKTEMKSNVLLNDQTISTCIHYFFPQ